MFFIVLNKIFKNIVFFVFFNFPPPVSIQPNEYILAVSHLWRLLLPPSQVSIQLQFHEGRELTLEVYLSSAILTFRYPKSPALAPQYVGWGKQEIQAQLVTAIVRFSYFTYVNCTITIIINHSHYSVGPHIVNYIFQETNAL